jgi:hypothetical protein
MENWLDGMEDYEYCALAAKRIAQLRDAGRDVDADKLAAVLKPYRDPGNEVVGSLKNFTLTPKVLVAARRKIALAICESQTETAED